MKKITFIFLICFDYKKKKKMSAKGKGKQKKAHESIPAGQLLIARPLPVETSYFSALCEGTGVEVRVVNERKGRGLFATQNFEKGDTLFIEQPLVATQVCRRKKDRKIYIYSHRTIFILVQEKKKKKRKIKRNINIKY